jgi:hypothetical protein
MKYCISFFCIFITAFTLGCKQNSVTTQTGVISGKVRLYNESGDSISAIGVIVSTIPASNTVQTNDSGIWQIKDIPFGSYTVVFTKQGFGSIKVFTVQLNGTDTVGIIQMTQPATDQINFQTFLTGFTSPDSLPAFTVQGQVPPPHAKARFIVLCISADSVLLTQDPSSALLILQFVTDPNKTGYDGGFYWASAKDSALHPHMFQHGQKIYATLCVSGEGSGGAHFSNYYDPTLHKQIFTALGPYTQILSAVTP